MTLEELAARVAVLEDERAILRTLHAYGHAIDYGLADAWADCFAENGVFDVTYASGGERRTYTGRAELWNFAERHTNAPDVWHRHVVVDPLITLDGDRAEVASYFVFVLHSEGRPIIRSFGRYLDDMARQPDGAWRFTRRRAEVGSLRPGLPPNRSVP
jgi:hypothetical protein